MAIKHEYTKYVLQPYRLGLLETPRPSLYWNNSASYVDKKCQDGDWMPFWGDLTKTRATLMKEMRSYWVDKWFGKMIPRIKNAIKETTILPEDIIEELPHYFEYPYQIKIG